MLSRRFIRVKVFKLLFSCVHSQNFDQVMAEKELLTSLERTRQLYLLIFSLPVALARYAMERIEIGRQKHRPTEEELDPNMRFVKNKVIALLENDRELEQARRQGLNWTLQKSYIRKLYDQLKEEPFFADYMNDPLDPDFERDMKLIQEFFSTQLEEDQDLYNLLEDQSLYWADDLAYVCNVILAQLAGIKSETETLRHPPLFYNDDDKVFATGLLSHSLRNYEEYVGYIDKFAQNWDLERIAATDSILIVMGVSEAVAFHQIPVKVTLNEMVEISKYYSTENSKLFVNGILDRVIKYLREEGRIEKRGKGLIEK